MITLVFRDRMLYLITFKHVPIRNGAWSFAIYFVSHTIFNPGFPPISSFISHPVFSLTHNSAAPKSFVISSFCAVFCFFRRYGQLADLPAVPGVRPASVVRTEGVRSQRPTVTHRSNKTAWSGLEKDDFVGTRPAKGGGEGTEPFCFF